MKAIQIKDSNRAAIEAALKSVNGNSTSHTYTSYALMKKSSGLWRKRRNSWAL